MGKLIIWLPRVITIILIGFATLFAFDSFIPSSAGIDNSTLIIISFLPPVLLLMALVLGWFYKLAGGIIFIAMGIAMTFLFDSMRRELSFLSLSFPVMIAGLLFLLSHFYEKSAQRR